MSPSLHSQLQELIPPGVKVLVEGHTPSRTVTNLSTLNHLLTHGNTTSISIPIPNQPNPHTLPHKHLPILSRHIRHPNGTHNTHHPRGRSHPSTKPAIGRWERQWDASRVCNSLIPRKRIDRVGDYKRSAGWTAPLRIRG